MRRRAPAGAAATALVLLAFLAVPGAAGARSVPRNFFGMNWDQEVSFTTDLSTRTTQFDHMAINGVEALRVAFRWDKAQPEKDGPIDFAGSDRLLLNAAARGIQLLPIVMYAPDWARSGSELSTPPKNDAAYARYLKALIQRYGPKGTFWSEHRKTPKHPIRIWQVWNEPSANYQWTIPEGQDWAPGYGKLLRKTYPVVKKADPGARVVLAGLPNTSAADLKHLYKKGHIHGYFDIGAIHPYTAHKHGVLTLVRMFRDVMDKHGDADKKLWVTEMGLPASKGQTDDKSELQTDDAGMAKFLTEAYTDLIKHRKSLKVDHVYWYNWASVYAGWIFKWTGLYKYHRGDHVDEFEAKPALKAYRKEARAAEGCKKDAKGACA